MATFIVHFHDGARTSVQAPTPAAAREAAKAGGAIARVKLDRTNTKGGRRLRRGDHRRSKP